MFSSTFLVLLHLLINLRATLDLLFDLFVHDLFNLFTVDIEVFALKSIVGDDCQHLLVVSSFVVSSDVLLFAVKNLILNVLDVVVFDVHFKCRSNAREFFLVYKFRPVLLSDRVSLAVGLSSIAENGSFVKSAVESTDDCGSGIPDDELFPLVDFVTDITLTLLNENDLSDLVKLFKSIV